MKHPRFALIGAAGFVAPRHMEAIAAVGGDLVCALDPHDSVGILDKHFPDCEFFTQPERFERRLHASADIDYVVVCSPNHLHDTHVRMGLYAGCNVICEKPLCLNPANLDAITAAEKASGKRVFVVLQLRLHPEVIRLRQVIHLRQRDGDLSRPRVSLDYCTPRGRWYGTSWKGDEAQSGGVLTNIGIHMFDALMYIFGDTAPLGRIQERSTATVMGSLTLPQADIQWRLSTAGREARRLLQIDDQAIDLSAGFDAAHTRVYADILGGRGFGVAEARAGVELCWEMRKLTPPPPPPPVYSTSRA